MRRSLQDYALLAEIVGAFAVVLSLLYVGYQIQTSTSERRVESVQSITAGYRELSLVYVTNEQASIAWHKVLDGEKLTKRELDLMSDSIYSHLMALEEVYAKYREGYISEEFLNARVALIREKILLSPQLRSVYEEMKQSGLYTQSFVEWLDIELKKSDLYDQPRRVESLQNAE